MVVKAIQRFPHQLPDIFKLINNVHAVFAAIVFHFILHIEGKRHVEPVQPDLVGVDQLVPEVAGRGAGLAEDLAVHGVDSLPVFLFSGQLI